MKITILSLFPQMFSGPFDLSIVKRAKEKGLVEISFVDIRDFGIGKHKIVDDKPYGGGLGMLLRADVLKNAIDSVKDKGLGPNEQKVILTSAAGKTFKQDLAFSYSKLKHLIIVCGHYEGVDERVRNFIDEEVSIGDYVLTGGELAAMVITDAVARLVKGVLKEGVVEKESFSKGLLEHEQYTRPKTLGSLKVPGVLLSGNHAEIEKWKMNKSRVKTKKIRKDLL